MKVYIVTDGSYSDYRILGVYSTRERAREAKKYFLAENDIEQWEMDEKHDSPPGHYVYRVAMDKQGNIFSQTLEQRSIYAVQRTRPDFANLISNCRNNDSSLKFFYVWARDEVHAVKVANEKRVQLIAESKWK